MVCLSVPLVPLLKLFDGFRCLQERGDLGDTASSQNMQLQIAAATWRIEMKSDSTFYRIALVLVNCITTAKVSVN